MIPLNPLLILYLLSANLIFPLAPVNTHVPLILNSSPAQISGYQTCLACCLYRHLLECRPSSSVCVKPNSFFPITVFVLWDYLVPARFRLVTCFCCLYHLKFSRLCPLISFLNAAALLCIFCEVIPVLYFLCCEVLRKGLTLSILL